MFSKTIKTEKISPGNQGRPTLNVAANVGTNVLLTGTGATSLKALKYADDWSGAAAALGQSVDHVSKQVLGTRMGDGLIAGGSNAAAQLIQNGGQVDQINWVDVGATTTAGVLGHGRGWKTNVAIGAGTGAASTEVNNFVNGTDNNVLLNAITGAAASGVGYQVGKSVEKGALKYGSNPAGAASYGGIIGSLTSESTSGSILSVLNIYRNSKSIEDKNNTIH